MSMNAGDLKPVTLEEFEAMEKDERFNYELIDGVVMMSPSPTFEHQTIGIKLSHKLMGSLESTDCQPLYEYDISFNSNVFKPDVMIFCHNNTDLPEIVFEILSPSTRQRDILIKPLRYQEMGVKEYWIVDPKVKTVTVHDFINQTAETYGIGETIYSKAIPEIVIAVSDIFA